MDPSAPDRDWSHLPADVLVSIFISLDTMDLFTAGAVCRLWRDNHLFARRLPSRCRNQSPCLLYSTGDLHPNEATLLRLSTVPQLRRVVALPDDDPPLRSRLVVGSSHGWLATADERSALLLVNPITGAQAALPSPLTIKNVRGRYGGGGVNDGYDILKLSLATRDCDTETYDDGLPLDEGRFYFYVRVAMSGDPSSGRSCIVMILHMPWSYLSFARVGDTRWTWIDVDQRCRDYNDLFYDDSDGLFYAVRHTGEVHTIDLSGHSPVVKTILRPVTALIDNYKYIVRAPWGDILEVWRYHHDVAIEKRECRTVRLVVYKVDLAKQVLTEMTDLREHVLFVGFNTPFFLPAKDCPMLTPNCIYATEDDMAHIYSNKFGPHQLAVFNMADGTCTDLFPAERNSWLQWPLPIWIRPSYSQDNNRCGFSK